MKNLNLPYPPMPEGADKNIIKPSASFKKEVYRATAAILLFVLTYIALFICALAIAVGFCLLGYAILLAHIGFFGAIIGVGLAISGLMLVFFVIKFLFKRNRINYLDKIEITAAEQPALFEFINRVTAEAQAAKPKRIFLTADVNAGVFYDSNFWSMFFPVKKNLQIGLGLINSVNVSEFKAVMAHEFGHFSQRSMKFGSYVYNLNRVIYNMLYENEGYGKLLNQWARIHNIFRAMAYLNINMVKGMQAILQKVYVIVNKAYLGLSREMEFHADAVAAYVSGSNHVVSSLKRIEIGQMCYSNLLEYWNLKFADNKRSLNFYPQQGEIIRYFADKHNLARDASGLPVVTNGMAILGSPQVLIDDQWSSHPSTEDREQYVTRLGLVTDTISEPAWLLFDNAHDLQVLLTSHVYSGNEAKPGTRLVDADEFKMDFHQSVNENSFDEVYKGYFDNRPITQFAIDEAIASAANAHAMSFEALFSYENCGSLNAIDQMQQDMALLKLVMEVRTDVKTFDYKGIKHQRGEAAQIQDEIEQECKQVQDRVKKLDKSIFIFFYNSNSNPEAREQLVGKYRKLFNYQTDAATDFNLYNEIMTAIKPIYGSMTAIKINDTVNMVYRLEKKLKPRLSAIIGEAETKNYLTAGQLNALEYYINAKLVYYYEPTYNNKSIAEFNKAMDAYVSVILKRNFEIKKDLLNFQLNLISNQ